MRFKRRKTPLLVLTYNLWPAWSMRQSNQNKTRMLALFSYTRVRDQVSMRTRYVEQLLFSRTWFKAHLWRKHWIDHNKPRWLRMKGQSLMCVDFVEKNTKKMMSSSLSKLQTVSIWYISSASRRKLLMPSIEIYLSGAHNASWESTGSSLRVSLPQRRRQRLLIILWVTSWRISRSISLSAPVVMLCK